MSRFRNLPPEMQSILVAITGTLAGTVISNLLATKKTMKIIVVFLILAAGIGVWIAAQRYFGGRSDLSPSFFDNSTPGVTVTNYNYSL